MDLQEIQEVGKTALSDDAPDGMWVRDDSEAFLLLEAEIEKLSSIHADGPVNWGKVVEHAVAIVGGMSKDIRACSYLCRGLWEEHGYQGLAAGLQVLRDVLIDHWDDAFPPYSRKRAKRRASEVEWIADKLGPALAEKIPEASQEETVLRAFDLLKEINDTLMDQLGDAAPNLRELRQPLETYKQNYELEARKRNEAEQDEARRKEEEEKRLQKEEEQRKQQAEQTGAAAESVAQGPASTVSENQAPPAAQPAAPRPVAAAEFTASAPQPGAIASGASQQEIKKVLKSCQASLRQVADYRRSLDPRDTNAYRMLRQSVWFGIDEVPGTDPRKGVCYFPPVPKSVRDGCEAMFQQQQFAELIELVEKTLGNPDAPANAYWLDGQRYCASAMEGLGAAYANARKAVIDNFAAFLRRLPGVEKLKFNDGSPLADDQTRMWIEEEVLAAAEGGPAGASGGGSEAGSERSAIIKDARKLAAKGSLEQALRLIQEQIGLAANRRERFIWDLEKARFCNDVGQSELALHQLEYLDSQVERFGLEDWEPALGAEVARLLILCYKQSADKYPRGEELYQRRFGRLCRLDTAAALEFSDRQ